MLRAVENAHRSLAAVGVLLATAGGALLPTSVLSCSPRWLQESNIRNSDMENANKPASSWPKQGPKSGQNMAAIKDLDSSNQTWDAQREKGTS